MCWYDCGGGTAISVGVFRYDASESQRWEELVSSVDNVKGSSTLHSG